jgi:5-hydroxyisourate hydrolase
MSAITTHVLDTSRGRPAAGLGVVLERGTSHDTWSVVGRGDTDGEGRQRSLMADGAPLTPGVYRLTFDTRRYFDGIGARTLFPSVAITFEAAPGESHYHVPLLLNAFGYTTYRGT